MRNIKNVLLLFFIIFEINMNAQINMIVKTNDENTYQYTTSTIDSIYYEDISSCNTVTDYDGNTYQTIKIAGKCWMAENLATTHYADGTLIPNVTGNSNWGSLTDTDKAYCWYNDDINNKETYGALYTYEAITEGNYSEVNVQGICPNEWHLPTDNDFFDLKFMFLDASTGSKLAGNAGLWEDGELKNDINFASSGFTIIPSGIRNNNGEFYGLGSQAGLGSSHSNSNTSCQIRIFHDRNYIIIDYMLKTWGFSVRCIQD